MVIMFDDYEWFFFEGEVRGCIGLFVLVWYYDLNILSNMFFGFLYIYNLNVIVYNGFLIWSMNGRKRV